ncbi:MAG: hypothetical protein PHW17_12010 [Desulfobacterales bacterium]|nr:hypothetical protein [Desulfobacterales bacterium]
MHIIRQDEMRARGLGAAAPVIRRLGFDMKPVAAYASRLKVQSVREMSCICPLCSAGCHCIAHVQGREVVRTEGEAGDPVKNSECALRSKGAAMLPVIAAELNILSGK